MRTALRVAGEDALTFWAVRFHAEGVAHGPVGEVDGRLLLAFEDPEGQRLALVDDGGAGPAHPWQRSPVPEAFQIRGLGPVMISIPDLAPTDRFLTGVMGMRQTRSYPDPGAMDSVMHVYSMGEGGPAAELHVRVEPSLPQAQPGAGSVHHIAFRIRDEEYGHWADRLQQSRIPTSGPVDRFYFRSLYTRGPGGILYEIATDGPGFAADEPLESLGERLSLPPFLEPRREAIEGKLAQF